MPAATSPNPNQLRAGSHPPDDLDRLLDYDNAVEDFLRDIPVGNGEGGNVGGPGPQTARDEDQEVQVKKKRKPLPKLDENRLLSDAGIPRLRKITRTRLKFRGKGHEFTDISRLLNTYQLWLDDLYPRAKFRDALTMVERVGHSKRMQVTRRAWLDDTKPHRRDLTPPADLQLSGAHGAGDEADGRGVDEAGDLARLTQAQGDASRESHGGTTVPEDDELDALMAEHGPGMIGQSQNFQGRPPGPFGEESDEDDLDALMAEQDATSLVRGVAEPHLPASEEPGEDELDALMSEQPHPHADVKFTGITNSDLPPPANDFAEEEEVLAGMEW